MRTPFHENELLLGAMELFAWQGRTSKRLRGRLPGHAAISREARGRPAGSHGRAVERRGLVAFASDRAGLPLPHSETRPVARSPAARPLGGRTPTAGAPGL